MIDLRHRSYEKELMDGADIPFSAMQQTLKELNVVNTWLGGHAITLKAVKKLRNETRPLTICEIGCGGGDNLHAIYKKYAAHDKGERKKENGILKSLTVEVESIKETYSLILP